MTDEQTTAYIRDLEARLKVIERYLTSQNVAWNVNVTIPAPPVGASGTMTINDRPKVLGYIMPLSDEWGANIRETPNTTGKKLYTMAYGSDANVIKIVQDLNLDGGPYKWYELESGGFVREDVVTFTPRWWPEPATPGKFPAPFTGYIVTNRHLQNGHSGIDLATFDKTPAIVSATLNGYVVKTALCGGCGPTPGLRVKSNMFGYGNFVIVAYPLANGDWLHCLMAHLSAIHVHPTQTLSNTTVIANVGNTGDSSGNHLHMQCRLSNTRDARWSEMERREVNPIEYFEI